LLRLRLRPFSVLLRAIKKECTERDSVTAPSQNAMILPTKGQCGAFFKCSGFQRRVGFRGGIVPLFGRRGGSERGGRHVARAGDVTR
jgi:hypothetical protein